MEPQPRKQAMWQGVLGVVLAPLWLIALGRALAYFSHPREGLQRAVVIALLFVGLAIAVVGVWRLSVARDRRWDLPGIVALCLIFFPGLPTLFLFLYLVVSGFMGQIFGGT
jgi:chromate transport protein ChrA